MANKFAQLFNTLRPLGLDDSSQDLLVAYSDRHGTVHGSSYCDQETPPREETFFNLRELASSRLCPDLWCSEQIASNLKWLKNLQELADDFEILAQDSPRSYESELDVFDRQLDAADRMLQRNYEFGHPEMLVQLSQLARQGSARARAYLQSPQGRQATARMYALRLCEGRTPGPREQSFVDHATDSPEVLFGSRTLVPRSPSLGGTHPGKLLLIAFGVAKNSRAVVIASSEGFFKLLQPTLSGILTKSVRLTPGEDLGILAETAAALWVPYEQSPLDTFADAVEAARAILA